MRRFPLSITRYVHENLSTVMCFAFARQPLIELMVTSFAGEWKYLGKAIFDMSEERANRAITELAVLLRILDDEEGITKYHKQMGNTWSCGRLILKNKEESELSFREFANKIIHAKTFSWHFPEGKSPKLTCYARDNEARKWKEAEVDLVALAAFCGQLMS